MTETMRASHTQRSCPAPAGHPVKTTRAGNTGSPTPGDDGCARGDGSPTETSALRELATMLCLWGLCAKAACRRARACKSEPRRCLSRYAPLVPEEARDGVAALVEGRQLGLSFEELFSEAPFELAALDDWAGRVHAAMRDRA